MTDDPESPAADSGETGLDPGSGGATVPTAGNDRRNVVYLVPSVPRTAADAASGAGTLTAQGDQAAERDGPPADQLPPVSGAFDPAEDPAERAERAEREDWAWVQEWRAGQEPTPWATGIALAVFSALIVGVAVWVLSAGLADRPVIAVLVNLLVAAGLTPAIWLSRGLPVLRWIAAGAAAGIVIGWVSAILLLPFPST